MKCPCISSPNVPWLRLRYLRSRLQSNPSIHFLEGQLYLWATICNHQWPHNLRDFLVTYLIYIFFVSVLSRKGNCCEGDVHRSGRYLSLSSEKYVNSTLQGNRKTIVSFLLYWRLQFIFVTIKILPVKSLSNRKQNEQKRRRPVLSIQYTRYSNDTFQIGVNVAPVIKKSEWRQSVII